MGLMGQIMSLLFGGGAGNLRDTAAIFRENADKGAERAALVQLAALSQFGAEFAHPRRGLFDRAIDGLNRLPRPLMAFGTLGLVVAAMVDPIWFAARMQGIALVPEPLWWLMGAIVSFYFGARHQVKAQEFQTSVARTASAALKVGDRVEAIEALSDGKADSPITSSGNAALDDWRRTR